MEGPRAPKSSEMPQIEEFLNRELRPGIEWSITSEYPTALNSQNLNNIRIIRDQTELLAHALVRPLLVRTTWGLIKTAAIGSVVTSSQHRNQGLSTKTIESCVELARSQSCDIAILWTNLFDFYRKLNFELAGCEMHLSIDKEFNGSTGDFRLLVSNKVAPESILKLYTQHSVHTLRSPEEVKQYLQIPKSQLYTVWNSQNQLLAYAVEGKGADLQSHIHEWGGGTSALIWLFSQIRTQKGQPITVIAPSHAKNLVRQLAPFAGVIHSGHLGMMRILNWTRVFEKIHRHAKLLGHNGLVLEKQGDRYVYGIDNLIWRTEDEKEITRFLLGPEKEAIHRHFKGLLPLPFWIWGWDSV